VVIDTCDSEAMGDALRQVLTNRGMSAKTAATVLGRSIELTALAASTSDQEAIEGRKDHGLFTYVVVDGLSGKAADTTSWIVTTDLLAKYGDAEVPFPAQTVFHHEQRATANTNGQSFPITKVK
jgi:uncharacterized caspase-like protein